MTNKHADLIKRLESATEGSRELDEELLRALGWDKKPDPLAIWREPNGRAYLPFGKPLPRPTTNLNDARALSDWVLIGAHEVGIKTRAVIIIGKPKTEEEAEGYAATLELAWCIAALKAKEIDDE